MAYPPFPRLRGAQRCAATHVPHRMRICAHTEKNPLTLSRGLFVLRDHMNLLNTDLSPTVNIPRRNDKNVRRVALKSVVDQSAHRINNALSSYKTFKDTYD